MSAEDVAKVLLKNKAVTLNAKEPYTYASGIRSPIYCDNRLMLGAVEDRKVIINGFIDACKGYEYDILAGTSTAGIPWAAWISSELKKPMAYIRGGKKDHGKGNQIEGAKLKGKKVLIIEDLVSTGGSSYTAVEAARDAGADVVGMVAIFTYEFEKAKKKFEDCKTSFLCTFSELVKVAGEMDYLNEDELKLVLDWNKAPAEWGPKHGFPNKE